MFKLCQFIVAQIKAAGRTQAQIARDLGVKQATVSRWLNDQATPDCESIDRILAAYPTIREELAVELLAWEA